MQKIVVKGMSEVSGERKNYRSRERKGLKIQNEEINSEEKAYNIYLQRKINETKRNNDIKQTECSKVPSKKGAPA
jgi:hypothetical protein